MLAQASKVVEIIFLKHRVFGKLSETGNSVTELMGILGVVSARNLRCEEDGWNIQTRSGDALVYQIKW